MDILDQGSHDRSNELDNLIVAAAAASVEQMESEMGVEECVNVSPDLFIIFFLV